METKQQTTCNYCALACNFDVYTENDAITKILPTKDYPVNRGLSCIKGIKLNRQTEEYHAPDLPRVKENGTFVYKSWDEAYHLTASKLLAIKEKHGSESIAAISTGQLATEEMAFLGHLIRNFIKGNVDGNTRLCMATAVVAYKQSFGFDAPPYTLHDFECSDTIILIGANPVIAHPVAWNRMKMSHQANKKIIVIDPRRSETAHQADFWYGLKPKSDLILFYTIANLLIEHQKTDQSYINEHTEHFEEFKNHVQSYTLKKAVAATGLSREQILELTLMIEEGKAVSFWWTMGVNQGYEAVRTAQSVINLALMTGNIGRPGTGANSLTGQCNAMGSRLFSNTTGLYGGGDYNNEKRRQAVAQAMNFDASLLPTAPTLPYNQIIQNIIDGKIKALWVVCTNPRHSWINNEEFQKALSNLDLFIVQDLYDDTESSAQADIFLPVASGLSKEGLLINTERRLSKLQPVITSKRPTDFQVFHGIGQALGMKDLLKGWETPASVFTMLKECSRGMPCDITGVDYQALNNSAGRQWPYPEQGASEEEERRLFSDHPFYTPSGKAQFIFEQPLNNPLTADENFSLILNTGRGTVGQWHTQSRTREIEQVVHVTSPEAYILINTQWATEQQIAHLDKVSVHSINGQTSIFIAHVTDDMPYDQCFAPMHYIETNRLTPSVFDAYSKEPSYKATPVRIRRETTDEKN